MRTPDRASWLASLHNRLATDSLVSAPCLRRCGAFVYGAVPIPYRCGADSISGIVSTLQRCAGSIRQRRLHPRRGVDSVSP